MALFFAAGVAGCAPEDDYEPPQLPAPPPPPPAPANEPAPLPEPYTSSSATPPAAPPTPPPPPASPPPNAPAAAAPAAPPAPPAPPADASEPPAVSYATGSWVYRAGQGWVWVPNGASTSDMEGVPYVYLYTPAYGWTWYVSPWGPGPYHYGVWVRHPWHPVGYHGYWVAHPRVVVRLGHGRGYRR
jgi:hypothetical protein